MADDNNNTTGTIFINGLELSQPKVRVPKLFHKKSRTGCQLCRARRVKVCYPKQ